MTESSNTVIKECQALPPMTHAIEDIYQRNNLSAYIVDAQKTIREAFKQATVNKRGFVLVIDDNSRITGIVTDGDFRRAIWNRTHLDDPIISIANNNFIHVIEGHFNIDEIRKQFLSAAIMQIPVLKEGFLADIIFREDFFAAEPTLAKRTLDHPVIIMAGGKGKRLDPFTRILPKPLIPIGEKAIIEIIMDKFAEYGITDFHLSLKHKQKMVRAFLEESKQSYKISYVVEQKFLGTAGALKYLANAFDKPVFVTNCDIIVDTDYSKISDFHRDGNYAMTIVGSMHHHVIPYGVCRLKSEGELEMMEEKPKYDLLVNTGVYLLNQDVLSMIPFDERFDMTDLIKLLRSQNKRVGVYPVSSESWIDVGRWEEYKKHIENLS